MCLSLCIDECEAYVLFHKNITRLKTSLSQNFYCSSLHQYCICTQLFYQQLFEFQSSFANTLIHYITAAKANCRRTNTQIKKLKYTHGNKRKVMLMRIQTESQNSTATLTHCFTSHGKHNYWQVYRVNFISYCVFY
jgi:hypothetical protein